VKSAGYFGSPRMLMAWDTITSAAAYTFKFRTANTITMKNTLCFIMLSPLSHEDGLHPLDLLLMIVDL
jgi:hypothetical protein